MSLKDFLLGISPKKLTPKEQAIQDLQRDSAWGYNKELRTYTYNGYEVSAEFAIDSIITIGKEELEKRIEAL